MIPEEKGAAVARALDKAFGVTKFEDIVRMTKGHTSALVFRVVVQGRPYLLRVIMRAQENPARHFNCLRAAAEAGLAPRVWYTSVEDRISITDFVQEVSFPAKDALVLIPRVIRKLHTLAPFPDAPNHLNTTCMFLINGGPEVDDFLGRFRAANIFAEDEIEEFFALYARLAAAYRRDEADMVSSHNDLFKPDNVLFDGSRAWLVDWEAAFRNDRYADLAVVANLLVSNEAEERIFLQEYFGQEPGAYHLARLFVMQQVTHLFYMLAYLFLGSLGQPVDWSEPVPDFREFQRGLWTGEIRLDERPAKILYGRVHWERLRQNVRLPRFEEALRVAAESRRPALPVACK